MGSPKTDLFPPVTFRGPQRCLVSPCHVLGSSNAVLCVFITIWGPPMLCSVPSGWPGVLQQCPIIIFCYVVGSPKLSYVPGSPNAVLCPLKVPHTVLGSPRAVPCSLGVSWGSLTLSCSPLSHPGVPNTVPCPRVPQHSPISPQYPPTLSHLPSLDSGVPQHCSASCRGVFRSPHFVVFPLSCPGDPHAVLCVPSCPMVP